MRIKHHEKWLRSFAVEIYVRALIDGKVLHIFPINKCSVTAHCYSFSVRRHISNKQQRQSNITGLQVQY